MQENELPFDDVFVSGFKPDAVAFFDDRAISVQAQKHGQTDYDRAIEHLDELMKYKIQEKKVIRNE